jgi:CelD/BcsL family acetyltransferase involved in cellulose biosynthesis
MTTPALMQRTAPTKAPPPRESAATAAVQPESTRIERLSVERLGLEALRGDWLNLEADGLATPYQSHAWVSAYAAHALTRAEGELACIRVRDGEGATVAVLPLAVRRRAGMTFAGFIGGKHANLHMGLFDRSFAARLDQAGARAVLEQASAALGGVDAFVLQTQPVSWAGVPNPIAALAAEPSPSQAYRLPLQRDADAALAASMSSHARKKHKNKRARFCELGASRLVVARDAVSADRILAAFVRQKAHRFAEMGVADPFADAGVQAFLHAGAADGAPDAPLLLAGLELEGRLVATYVGARHGERFSGMATSFEPDPAVMKVSPGEILLVDLIRWACGEGYAMFDLGVGEARYKTTICNETEALVDSFIAVSARGRLAAEAMRLQRRAKGWVKRHPAALALARRLTRPKGADASRPDPAGEAASAEARKSA